MDFSERSSHLRRGTAGRRGRQDLRARLRVAGCTLAATSLLLTAAPAGAGEHQNLHGTFTETATGAGLLYDITGSAKLTVGADWTTAKVNIAGLDPSKTYGSHVHNGTCASGGGGHYQDVVSTTLVTPPNELWLSSSEDPRGRLEPNRGGVAHGRGAAAWAARLTSTTQTNARSIVVHEPVDGGPRIACADLS